MADIGIIVTSGAFKKLAHQIVDNAPDIVISFGTLDEGVEKAVELIKVYDVKVIISTSLTGEKIKMAVDIPVITAEISNFQLLQAIYHARTISRQICFLDVNKVNQSYDLNKINKLLDFEVSSVFLSDLPSTQKGIEEAKRQGAEVLVVTGNCMSQMGKQIGLPSIVIHVGREEVVTAIEHARSIIRAKKKERERNLWLDVIMNNSYDAIILVDEKGIIQLCNKTMEDYFSLDEMTIKCRSVTQLSENYPILYKLYNDGLPTLSEIIEWKGQKFSLNRSLVVMDNDTKGCVINIKQIRQIQELERKVRKDLHRNRMYAKSHFDEIIGESAVMKKTKKIAIRYADSKFPVLICGESGTGKEIFSQSIHNMSPYRNGPFLGINCAALQETLLESELFGYEEGAFTGAKKGGKVGLFELVHGGTIFLDEISEMSISLQSRLLRVLQEKEVIRVGGNHILPIDTRIICATNKNLQEQVNKGEFRQDLFYRINTLTLALPPLRERKDDIPNLVSSIFDEVCSEAGKALAIDPSYLHRLQHYDWPGNIRELRSFIEKLVLLSEPTDTAISLTLFNELFMPLTQPSHAKHRVNILSDFPEDSIEDGFLRIQRGTLEDMENEIISILYSYLKADKDKLSRELGMSKTTLWRRLKNKDLLN